MIKYFLDRLKEPSTWVSLGQIVNALGSLLGFSVSPENWEAISIIGGGIATGLGMLGAGIRDKQLTS